MSTKANAKTKGTEVAKVEAGFVDAANTAVENQLVSEIKMITAQTKQMVLFNTIEIGRRLTEAKKLVKHGQWGKWLEERVSFTQRSANNFMKIFQQYGETGLAENSKSIANLSYTHALTLLDLPSEERKRFVEENNAKDMTIKQLKDAIANLNAQKAETERGKSEVERQLVEAQNRCKELIGKNEKAKADADKEAARLNDQIHVLEQQAKEAHDNKEREVQAQLETAVEAERKKLAEIEEDRTRLQDEITALKKQQREATARAKAEERKKAEAELAEKDKELAALKTRMKTQAKEASDQLKAAKVQVKEAQAENAFAGELAKCSYLIEEVLDGYAQIADTITEYGKHDKTKADSMFTDLENSLAAIRKKAGIKAKIA